MTCSGNYPLEVIFIFIENYLRNKEFIFCNAVKRDKGKKNGNFLHIRLILGVIAVISILAELKSACTAEHNKNDAYVADKSKNPLTCAAEHVYARNKNTGPENHFAKIVGAANDSVKSCVAESLGVLFL